MGTPIASNSAPLRVSIKVLKSGGRSTEIWVMDACRSPEATAESAPDMEGILPPKRNRLGQCLLSLEESKKKGVFAGLFDG